MVLRLWSRLVYNEESIACEPCRVGLRPAVLFFSILLALIRAARLTLRSQASSTPEPGTALLFGAGLGLVAIGRRRA
jgi:hypothetical protein